MKTPNPSRLIVAFIVLFSMLFTQLAMASYVCPSMDMTGRGNVQISAMANCEGMDQAQPGLCHVHAHTALEKQSLDKSSLPDIQPFLAGELVLALYAVDISPRSTQSSPDSVFLNAPQRRLCLFATAASEFNLPD